MNKPITSKKFASDLWGVVQMAINEAVLAEREACANHVKQLRSGDDYGEFLANAIRARGQA